MRLKSLLYVLPFLTLSSMPSMAVDNRICQSAGELSTSLLKEGYVFFAVMKGPSGESKQYELLIAPKTDEMIMIEYNVGNNGNPTTKACVDLYSKHIQIDQSALNAVYDKYAKNPE